MRRVLGEKLGRVYTALGMSELDQYDYHLPPELIAQHPLTHRVDARLLVVNRKQNSVDHSDVRHLPQFLAPGDCLVLNDTKVIPARLTGYRDRTGGRWNGLFLSADDSGIWKLLCKTRGKLQPGETVTLLDRRGREVLSLLMVTKLEDGVWAARPDASESTFDILDRVGRVPLPPYIRGGEMTEGDRETYQTIFARTPGAVAAPTAGLHFTQDLLAKITDLGVTVCRVTLHVGVGTFRPMTAERLEDHKMHSEWGRVEPHIAQLINERKEAGGRVVAVGTTVVRTLETAASSGHLQPWTGDTTLFIRPPYQFRAVDAMMTNFHLPKSTLLVLVRTFGGDDLMRRAYAEAIRESYRFYSYGDAMLIL